MIKLRNQANKIIAYSLAEDHLPELNGEKALLLRLSPLLKTVFDVGANKGEWSELLLQTVPEIQQVYLFEPGQAAYKTLQSKFLLNAKCSIENMGLSDVNGKFTFYEGANAAEHSSFVDTADKSLLATEGKLTTIDSFVFENNVSHINLLKIDTEGLDFRVILGSKNMLGKQQIDFVQFEYGANWRHAGHTLKAAISLFDSSGYQVFSLQPNGLKKFDPEYYREYYGYSNFIAVRKSLLDSINSFIIS